MTATSPPIPEQGQLVDVRQRRYVVTEVEASTLPSSPLKPARPLQHLVTLTSVEDDALGEELQVVWELEPGTRVYEKLALPDPTGFDPPARLDAFLDAVRWGAASSADIRSIQSPFRSGIEVQDYQLDPVVRAIQMPRVSLLVADDVGLGKTIEAGLVVLELLIRHRARRVLVVCPASLQVQWRDQMRDKFGLDFRIVDSELLRQLRRSRGLHVNPWTHHPRLITSIDFLKRERPLRLFREALPGPGESAYPRRFDILVCDESHNFAPSGRGQYATDSLRTEAIRLLAPHFEHKLFLTATPHNGYPESFSALLELLDAQRFARGVTPDRQQLGAVMVRRLKSELKKWDGSSRFPSRKLEAIEVPYTEAERRAQRALQEYAAHRQQKSGDAVEQTATEFVLKLLKKRLFSSPAAFAATLAQHEKSLQQARRWLHRYVKPGSQWADERVIVFTEYRATRNWLQTLLASEGLAGNDRLLTLYGGMNSVERERIKAAFQYDPAGSPVRILLATDAASEGIDLQNHCCRLVHYARRLVAQRCLYGVDKNPVAVEMAKLSLWLLTLAKGQPFTFLDHAIRSGDSLLGVHDLDQLRYFDLRGKVAQPRHALESLRGAIDRAVNLRRAIAERVVNDISDVDEQERQLRESRQQTGPLILAADLLVGDGLKGGDEGFIALVAHFHDEDRTGLEGQARGLLGKNTPFHWPLEFPEVFARGGFDAFMGNPPFMGGKKITGYLGDHYREFLVKHLAQGRRGNADLAAYFFLRRSPIATPGGGFGLVSTNTIAQGDTREVALDLLLALKYVVWRAHASRPWPGMASLEISIVWVRKSGWSGIYVLDDKPVSGITPYLTPPGAVTGNPRRLKANEGTSHIGSYVLGMGFVLPPDEAQTLIARDIRNKDVLLPYLNGEDLNSRPDQSPSRWVINFRDWPEQKARTFTDCFQIVEDKAVSQNNVDGSLLTYRPESGVVRI